MSIKAFPFSQLTVDIMSSNNFTMTLAAELDFKDGITRVHTGQGSIVIDGNTYVGVSTLGKIGNIRESSDSSGPVSVDLVLSGLDEDVVKSTLQDKCRGRNGRLFVFVMGADGQQSADILFSGKMDAAKFKYSQSNSSITVPLQDGMTKWNRRSTKRWTDENHQLRNPGDRFFFAIAQMSKWPIYWGRSKNAPSFEYNE